jgi:ankyrin repeat protein
MSKGTIFDGCVFSTAGNLSRSTLDITKAVKENGGSVSYLITKKTTHLLTTDAEVANKSSKIKTAASYGAHVVKEGFVWDSISAHRLLDVNTYLFPVSTDEHAAPTHATLSIKSDIKGEKENKPEIKATPTITSTFKPLSHTSEHQPTLSFGGKPTSSQIDPNVQEFVEYIYSEAKSEFITNFDVKFTPKGIETPLGVLSSFQIDKGERVLKEINNILKASEEEVCSNSKLETLSSQFYTTIPHNIGKTKEESLKHVIRTLPHLQAKQDQLQLMRDILSANSSGALKSELDVKYKALKCDIQYLKQGSSEYHEVEKLVSHNQENEDIEIVSIYKIKRANEHERFTRSIANPTVLFHGTHITNVVGVLSRGILPPKTVVGVGGKRTDFGWLGSGIYFAPNPRSSVKFTTAGSRGTRVLLVATVALGTTKEYDRITPNLERPPMGFHSAHGKPGHGSEFNEDEYVVYKPEQQKLEYLVEFRLRGDGKPKIPSPVKAKSPKKAPTTAVPTSTSSWSQPSSSAIKPSHPASQVTATTPLTHADAEIKSKEDHYRDLFVSSRNHSDLKNPHLLLVDLSNTAKFTYSTHEPEYPLILQSTQRKRQGCAVVSQSEFRENFDKFTENQFKGMNWDNVFVAGGCVLASMLRPDVQGNGYKSSDVDMFFYGLNESQANQKLKYIYELVKQNTQSPSEVIRTKHAVTIVNQFPYRHIQIVLRLYKSPAEVLMGFDIDACAVGYDGKNAYALERACRAITRGYNLVDMSRRSLTYESRLYKYSKRGFAVAIPGFDRNKVNPEIFSKSLKDVKGLAQLLLFEFNAFKNSVTKNPFKSNKVPTSQIKHPDSFTEDRLQEFETLRANRELPDSDYSSVYIPWGPQWFAKQILNVLNYQDKAQFFANKNNIRHKHIFVSGIEGVLEGKSFWCKRCKDQIGRGRPQEENAGDDYVAGPLKWLQDNPGRQLLTGSFHPVTDDEWELQAYRPHQDGLFDLLSAIFSNNTSQIERTASAQQAYEATSTRMHPLLFAALLGNTQGVEALLRAGARQSEVKDQIGLRAIHYAAASGNLDVVRALVRHESRVAEDADNANRLTPLHLALYYGHKDTAQFLIEKLGHSRASSVDSRNRSNIIYAALGGDVECCKLVLQSGQDSHLLHTADANGLTPISAAMANGHTEVLKYFLTVTPSHINMGAPVDANEPQPIPPPFSDVLPVLSVVASGQLPTDLHGANEADSFGVHPLHVAATLPNKYDHILDTFLRESSVDRNCIDVIGQTPSHYSALYGNTNAFSKLSSSHEIANVLGQTPLYYVKILLSTFSGFQNEYIEGLPKPSYRRKLEEISRTLLSGRHKALVLSPYPLPPLLPSEYLSVPAPIAQPKPTQSTTRVIPAIRRPTNLLNFGVAVPTEITGKFESSAFSFGTAPTYNEEPKRKPMKSPAKANPYGTWADESDDSDDSDESKPASPMKGHVTKATGGKGFFGAGFGSTSKPTSSGFGTTAPSFGFGSAPKSTPPGFSTPAPGLGFVATPAPSSFGTAPDPAMQQMKQQLQEQSQELQQLRQLLINQQQQQVMQQQAQALALRPVNTFSSATYQAQAQQTPQDLPSITARLLVLVSLLNKGRTISMDAKNQLKDLVLQGHPLLVAALECYEVDGDLEEFGDTAERLLATLRR